MSYLNHAIDNSPTIRGTAGAAINTPGLLAVKFDTSGNLVLPSAGDLLKPDATGKAIVATAGDAVSAIALEAAASGKPCKAMICHTAIPAAAQGVGG